MKTLLLILALTFSLQAEAAVKPYFQDAKFPTQQMIEKQAFGSPVVASASRLSSAIAGVETVTSVTGFVISSFTLQPDVPRNLVITPGGTGADVGTCTITVTGKNFYNQTITETFASVANTTTAITGVKAFKSVASVSMPGACEDAPFTASWSIGVGEKIGLKNCLSSTGDWIQSSLSGTLEATRATLVVDDDEVEKNTADFNGTMDGSAPFIGYFMQNYRCHP